MRESIDVPLWGHNLDARDGPAIGPYVCVLWKNLVLDVTSLERCVHHIRAKTMVSACLLISDVEPSLNSSAYAKKVIRARDARL